MTDRRSAWGGGTVAAFLVELRRTGRDRRTLVLVFAMPVVIATIVVYALGSTDEHGPVALGWVATSSDDAVDLFVQEVIEGAELDGAVAWRRFPTEAEAAAAVAGADPGAAIVIGAASTPTAPAELRLLADEDPVAAGVAATVIDRFRVAHAATVMTAESGTAVASPADTVTLDVAAPSGASLDAAVHWGPALGVFFVLLAMGHAAHRQVEDRHRDVTARLASVPCGPAPIVAGRALAATGIGASSLMVMAATTHLVFGRAWGPWPQLVAVALATALAVAGVGAVIAGVSTTPGRAQSLTTLAAFGLGIAGGAFSPLGSSGPPSGISRWLPTSLSLDAFGTVTTTGRWGALAVPLVVLSATGLGLFAVGGLQARRWVA